MTRKVDTNLIKTLNTSAEGQKVEKIAIKQDTKRKGMNIDECIEYVRSWRMDKKGD